MASTPGSWTSVGKKIVIALTGMGLMVFLLGHVAGNLLIFAGDDTFNAYGHTLSTNPLTEFAEVGITLFFLFHIVLAGRNWMKNKGARQQRYYASNWAGGKSRKSLASSVMILSGALVLVFLVGHVLTMKYGLGFVASETSEGFEDLALQVRQAFANPITVLVYEVMIVMVGMHLWHGFSSAFQSLGISHPKLEKVLRPVGFVFACCVGGGFLSIPFAIFLKLI